MNAIVRAAVFAAIAGIPPGMDIAAYDADGDALGLERTPSNAKRPSTPR